MDIRVVERKACKTRKFPSQSKKVTSKPKVKKWKFKKTELQKFDTHFSLKIRNRDGRCQFPGCPIDDIRLLQNSHYENRGRWETRFDEDNCIAICWNHHYGSKIIGWEFAKQRSGEKGADHDGKYTLFMKDLLGETRFLALINKPKQSRKIVMTNYKAFLEM